MNLSRLSDAAATKVSSCSSVITLPIRLVMQGVDGFSFLVRPRDARRWDRGLAVETLGDGASADSCRRASRARRNPPKSSVLRLCWRTTTGPLDHLLASTRVYSCVGCSVLSSVLLLLPQADEDSPHAKQSWQCNGRARRSPHTSRRALAS